MPGQAEPPPCPARFTAAPGGSGTGETGRDWEGRTVPKAAMRRRSAEGLQGARDAAGGVPAVKGAGPSQSAPGGAGSSQSASGGASPSQSVAEAGGAGRRAGPAAPPPPCDAAMSRAATVV